MREETYTKLLDIFTWAVVGLLTVYILLWVIEYYNTKSIDLTQNDEKDELDDIKEEPIENKLKEAQQSQNKSQKKQKSK